VGMMKDKYGFEMIGFDECEKRCIEAKKEVFDDIDNLEFDTKLGFGDYFEKIEVIKKKHLT